MVGIFTEIRYCDNNKWKIQGAPVTQQAKTRFYVWRAGKKVVIFTSEILPVFM
jgi:hypothetical protein